MNVRRTFFTRAIACAAALAGAAAAPVARAADWPDKPVRLVVPYAPGGSADTLGRFIAQQLSKTFGQPFVVENKPGAGGLIGSQQVARADPDGYTLVVSGIGSHVVAPFVNPTTFDPIKDCTYIAMLGGPPAVLVVNSAQPFKTLADFIAQGKSAQGISYGTPGSGTHGALIGEAFRQASKTNLVQISYKGAGQAVADLAANQIPAGFFTLSTALSNIKAGRLRALAVTANARLPELPDVPTFKELGYPSLVGTTWFSLSGPPGMPPDLVNKLNLAVRKAMLSPEGQEALRNDSMQTQDWDSATFTNFVKQEIAHWKPYITADMKAGN